MSGFCWPYKNSGCLMNLGGKTVVRWLLRPLFLVFSHFFQSIKCCFVKNSIANYIEKAFENISTPERCFSFLSLYILYSYVYFFLKKHEYMLKTMWICKNEKQTNINNTREKNVDRIFNHKRKVTIVSI